MEYKLRDYQQQASDAAIRFFSDKKSKKNAIMVLPTGSGKSLIIADIAARLDGHVLVFQPSKEILEQNYLKLCSYGVLDCSIYSASFGRKDVSRITFATIGSVKNHPELFGHFHSRRHMATRFDEDNAHAECRACNRFKADHMIGYRDNLIAKIGQQRFDRLAWKAAQTKKWTDFELQELIKYYKALNKQMMTEK